MQVIDFKLSKGDWVFHPRMPDWGYGKILELTGDKKGRVFFLLAGEKKLSWEHAGLGIVQGDEVSQSALNDQLIDFKFNLAIDLVISEALNQGIACIPCDSPGSKCELCKSSPDVLRIYSLAHKGKMCICDVCRDKILLENKDNLRFMEVPTVSKEKKKRKLKIVKA
ncbi:hypothetical protein SBDP1_970009 [Syntrophobacter sp. SbD1]|nr:hypothetical protein SBDP1_970009 [Syntrophobacter sp. SbD1]